jgi:hypothetical protein
MQQEWRRSGLSVRKPRFTKAFGEPFIVGQPSRIICDGQLLCLKPFFMAQAAKIGSYNVQGRRDHARFCVRPASNMLSSSAITSFSVIC